MLISVSKFRIPVKLHSQQNEKISRVIFFFHQNPLIKSGIAVFLPAIDLRIVADCSLRK